MQAAKDAFGVFIREQIATIPVTGLDEFYRRTKPDIRSSVERLRHFIGGRQKARLNRLWYQYEHIREYEFDRPYERVMTDVKRELSIISGEDFKSPYQFQSAYEAVRYYLDKFYKFSFNMTLEWIAERLCMGAPTYLVSLHQRHNQNAPSNGETSF